MNRRLRPHRAVAVLVGTVLAATGLSACGGSGDGGSTARVSAADLDKALDKPTDLTVWSWSASLPDVAKAFEKEHPKIKIKIQNVGTSTDQYTKLQNAIKAGKGAPDLATVEYSAMPQFALSGSLVDLHRFSFDSLEKDFTKATWESVKSGDGLYELPLNAGPMAMFYNKKVFDKYHITVPTTWDEYLKAAKKLHDAAPGTYIAGDNGNAGLTESLIWAADGRPFSAEGDKVSVNLQDAGTKRFAADYQKLIDGKLLMPVNAWSPEWTSGLTKGKIATLLSGAWMSGTLKSGVPGGSGDWRVAPMPTYDGKPASAFTGGGSLALLKQSKNQLAAAAFLRYVSIGKGADITQASGSFPARADVLKSEKFLGEKDEYFGGQQVNRVFADSLSAVRPGWQYLPYDAYATSIFNDKVGKAFTGSITLQQGLDAWQEQLVGYGKDQGFSVG